MYFFVLQSHCRSWESTEKKKNILFCKKVSYFTQIYENKDFGDNTFCLVIQETIKGKKNLCLPF